MTEDRGRITIVLVEPQGDANIGAVARAMKNFGITDLRLVAPSLHLTRPAYTWAVDAKDILENARIFKTLEDALADTTYSIAFTRRMGKRRKQNTDASEAAAYIMKRLPSGKVALVFGREDKGLSNAEIRRCDLVATIPTSEKLPSINLAQSVILACYEIYKRKIGGKNKKASKATQRYAPRRDLLKTLKRIEAAIESLSYEDEPGNPLKSKILGHFEKIFGRAGLTLSDIRMFEGLTARIMGAVKKNGC